MDRIATGRFNQLSTRNHQLFQMVAREGSAPPISGCRPDVILFHHRAFRNQGIDGLIGLMGSTAWGKDRTQSLNSQPITINSLKMAAGDGLAPPQAPSKGDVLLLDDPAEENAE